MERVEEGIDKSNVTPKRVEGENIVEEEDRISALPDCLLLEILSRLPSTESAIVTGTLSKRWKYLWTWVPTLIFKRFSKGSLSNFISFVEKTLTQCRQSKLKKFAIDYNYDMQLGSQVVSWVHYAISRNVEELDLRIFCYDVDIWNESFYSNSCFTDLRLQGCRFNPTGAISWKRLKSLWIYQGNLNADLMENILLGSPLLETVVLEEIYGTWRICITSKSIKKLEFFDYWDPDDGEFDLQVNYWVRYAISCNVEELDLNFLMDMNLNPEYFITELNLNDDFSVNSCFTHMKLSCCIFNVKGVIDWKRLRSLYIGSGRLDEDLIENILSGSPLLETLVLNDCYGYKRLNITSKSVKKLVCSRYSDRGGEFELASAIEINAPNILSLTIQGHLQLLKLSLSNVSSLVEANLNISTVCLHDETTPVQEEILKALFQSLRHVKKLKIGDYYCEVVLEKYKEATLEKHKKDRDPEIVPMGSSENCNTGRPYVDLISEEAKQVTRVAELEQLKGKIKKLNMSKQQNGSCEN